jgi:flagellar biosynthesis chaperone FliJ
MKRFVWRLQKVLDVKIKEEQLRRTELFQIVEQLAARRGELLLRQRILQDLMTEIQRRESAQRLNAQEFFLRHAATDDAEIRRLQEEIAAWEVRHKEKTAEVLAVRRFREGLEKLRAQAKEEYMREQERLEQKEQDERATIAFARNESGADSE